MLVRESVQKRITQIRAKLRRLDEAFLYESSVDRATYEEQRDRLREELTLAELELSEARVEQFDIALAKAISVLNSASALDRCVARGSVAAPGGSLPAGARVGWRRISSPGYVLLLLPLDAGRGLRTSGASDRRSFAPISLTSNELRREFGAEVNVGTGTGIRTPVPWLRNAAGDVGGLRLRRFP